MRSCEPSYILFEPSATTSPKSLLQISVAMPGQHLGFCSRGGKIAVFAYGGGGGGGGGKRYMLYNIIYTVFSRLERARSISFK